MQGLLDIARAFLQAARTELEEGLIENNHVKVREGAEKAWNAVVQATDHAMKAHGRLPGPGGFAHRSRRTFLEGVGRMDLARGGRDPPEEGRRGPGGGQRPEGAEAPRLPVCLRGPVHQGLRDRRRGAVPGGRANRGGGDVPEAPREPGDPRLSDPRGIPQGRASRTEAKSPALVLP